MYKILANDGKEYGPADLDQMRRWVAEGRVNAQTRVLPPGATEWRPAGEVPELQPLLSRPASTTTTSGAAGSGGLPPGEKPKHGLAVTSFVLGLLSVFCLGILAGLPAIITGHIAHNRARRQPGVYGGGGFAIAGFVLGYLSLIVTVIMLAVLLPALAKAKAEGSGGAECKANMMSIHLALFNYAAEHDDLFPYSVSTNSGGTLELSAPTEGGYATRPAVHFQALVDQLEDPSVLVCPGDRERVPVPSVEDLTDENISYRLRVVPGIETNMNETILMCPIHGYELKADGGIKD